MTSADDTDTNRISNDVNSDDDSLADFLEDLELQPLPSDAVATDGATVGGGTDRNEAAGSTTADPVVSDESNIRTTHDPTASNNENESRPTANTHPSNLSIDTRPNDTERRRSRVGPPIGSSRTKATAKPPTAATATATAPTPTAKRPFNKSLQNVAPRYLQSADRYIQKARTPTASERANNRVRPTSGPVPSTNGTYIWERTHAFQQHKKEKIAVLESAIMQQYTFTPTRSPTSTTAPTPNSSASAVSVFDRLHSRETAAMRARAAARSAAKHNTQLNAKTVKSTKSAASNDTKSSNPRLYELFTNGQSKLRSLNITQKEDDEARRRRMEAQDLANCTFQPNTKWNLAADRLRQARKLRQRGEDNSQSSPPFIPLSERERLERDRRREEAELANCTFAPRTKWNIRAERTSDNKASIFDELEQQADSDKRRKYDKSFYDDNTEALRQHLPIEINTANSTPRKKLDNAVSPLGTPDIGAVGGSSRYTQSQPSIPEVDPSNKSLTVPELKKTGRHLKLTRDSSQESQGTNESKPHVVRSHYVGAISPPSPVWRQKYKKIAQTQQSEEVLTAQGRSRAEDVQIRGASRIDAGGYKSPARNTHSVSANSASVAHQKPHAQTTVSEEPKDDHTAPAATNDLDVLEVPKKSTTAVVADVGGFQVAKQVSPVEIDTLPRLSKADNSSNESRDSAVQSKKKKTWTERLLGNREKKNQERKETNADATSMEREKDIPVSEMDDNAEKAVDSARKNTEQLTALPGTEKADTTRLLEEQQSTVDVEATPIAKQATAKAEGLRAAEIGSEVAGIAEKQSIAAVEAGATQLAGEEQRAEVTKVVPTSEQRRTEEERMVTYPETLYEVAKVPETDEVTPHEAVEVGVVANNSTKSASDESTYAHNKSSIERVVEQSDGETTTGKPRNWLSRITRRARGNSTDSSIDLDPVKNGAVGAVPDIGQQEIAQTETEAASQPIEKKAGEETQLKIEERRLRGQQAEENAILEAKEKNERTDEEHMDRLSDNLDTPRHEEAEQQQLNDEEKAEQESASAAAGVQRQTQDQVAVTAPVAATLEMDLSQSSPLKPRPESSEAVTEKQDRKVSKKTKKKGRESDRAKRWKERLAKKTKSNEDVVEMAESNTSQQTVEAGESMETSFSGTVPDGKKRRSDREKTGRQRLQDQRKSPKSSLSIDHSATNSTTNEAYPRVLYSDNMDGEHPKEPEIGSI